MSFLGKDRWGVSGLGSSACKIPNRFPSESAFEFHLPRQTPYYYELRRRLESAELALAVPALAADRPYFLSGYGGGPNRRVVKVPDIVPGKIPNPTSISGKRTKTMSELTAVRQVVRYEEVATDPTAVWRIVSASNLRPSEEPRDLSDRVPPAVWESEKTRRSVELRRITLKSTQGKHWRGAPEGNLNPPPTGYSAVPDCWGQSQLPHAFVATPTLNKLNTNSESELARQWDSNPRNDRAPSFFKSLAKGPILDSPEIVGGEPLVEALDSPEIVGGEPLVEAVVQKKESTMKSFTPGDCKYCRGKGFLEHKCKHYQQVNLMAGVSEDVVPEQGEFGIPSWLFGLSLPDAVDLAVLEMDSPTDLLKPINVGQSSALRVGQQCSAIGNPFGFDHILTAGVISGLNRDIFSKAGVTIEDGAHFHMKQGALLHNLEAQTLPKSLHCNFIRLTLEYFKYSSLDAYEFSACKMNRTQVSLIWILDQLPEERTILVKLLYFCKYCADNEAINIWNKNHLKVEMGNVSSKHLVLALLVKDRGKGSHSDLKDINHSYLWEAWKKKYPESASDNSDKLLSLRIVLLELPQQDNSFDCGLFLLHYVELFLMDTPSSFNPLDVISCTPEDAEDSMISSAVSEKTTEVIEDPGLVGMSQIDSTTALSNTRTQVGGFSVGQVQKAEPLFSGAYEGPVTALALDSMRNYSGSWDMTVCIWGRAQMKFVQKFMNADLGWPLASHGNTVTSTAGRDAYLWDSGSGELTSLISNAYVGNTYSLARTHLSDVLFTRGEDGAIRLFGVWDVFDGEDINPAATLVHHTSPVHSLAFEYPWLVSAYCDGRISLIELWKLLTPKSSSKHQFRVKSFGPSAIEPSQRTLHGFGCSFFSIDIGADGIEFGGENFFDPIPKKWTTKNTGPATCKGSFVQFYYEPIKLILKTCMTDQKDKLWSILRKLGVTLKTEEKELIGKALMKHVMQTWLPANNALLEMMMFHLPSPSKTQKYHVEKLYEGSLDDIYTIAIRNCEQEGKVAEQIRSAIEQSTPDYVKEKLQERLAKLYGGVVVLKIGVANESSADAPKSLYLESVALRNSIVLGFQFATNAGPLCDEPMWGLAFIVEPYIFADNSDVANQSDHDNIFSRQVITAVREACRAAVLQSNTRLVEVMYFCELTTPTEQLGSTYAVLSKKRARVLKEEMQEGTTLFTTHAYLPVAESFGFSNQLRSVTSGAASALLVFSHWEVSSEDPFFTPKTQEVDSCLIRAMKFFVFPVVRVAVQCNAVSDLPKLVESLKCLTKPDHMVLGTMEESGEHIIAGAGELHLEVCLKDLLKKLLGRLLILSKGHSLSFILKLLSHGSQMRILEDKYCAEGEGMSNLKKIEVRKNSAILKILKNNVSEQHKFSFLGWLRFHLTA